MVTRENMAGKKGMKHSKRTKNTRKNRRETGWSVEKTYNLTCVGRPKDEKGKRERVQCGRILTIESIPGAISETRAGEMLDNKAMEAGWLFLETLGKDNYQWLCPSCIKYLMKWKQEMRYVLGAY